VRVAPDGTAVIAGRAAPGARVVLMDGDRELKTVEADARGQWATVIDGPPLAPGGHDLRLVQRQDDREIARSERTVAVMVPERSPTSPTAAQPPAATTGRPESTAAAAPPAPLVVSTPGTGGPSTVIQAPGGTDALAHSGQLVLGAVDYDEKGRLTLTGQAPPGTTVRVYVDNQPAGDATAGFDGRWTMQPAEAVPAGKRSVRVDQLDRAGAVASRLEVPFERLTLAKAGVVTIVRGDNLWNIARSRYGDGFRYTTIYEANKNQIRDPNLIYPGQIFVVPKNP
jgi:nucleoid-associated protein YgaU